jgi:WD40 repeat protein
MCSRPRLSFAARLVGFLTLVAAGAAARADAPADAFGDPLPPGAVARLGTARLRHACVALAWAPDGKTLVSSGQDGVLRFWDPADGKEIRQIKQPFSGGINAIVYDPDGKHLIAGGGDGTVHVLDEATGRDARALPPPSMGAQQITAVALRPDDGTVLTLGADGSVGARDLETGASVRLTEPPANSRFSARGALSPDGRCYAVWTGDDLMTVYDAAGKELFHATTLLKPLEGLAFSPDGKTLAAWSTTTSQVALWDVQSGKETGRDKGALSLGRTLTFTPDGKALASFGRDGAVHVRDAASGKDVQKFPLSKAPQPVAVINAGGPLAFSPDGKTLAAAQGTAIRLWDVETGKERGEFVGHAGAAVDVRFSPDGGRVISCGRDGTAGVWDAATGKLVTWRTRPEGNLQGAAIAPDGKTLLLAQPGGVVRWDLTAEKTSDQPLVAKLSGAVTALTLSADGKTLAGHGPERSIYVWDAESGKEKLKAREPGVSPILALSADGGLLAVGGANAPTRLWDVAAGKEGRRLDDGTGQPNAGAPGAPASPFPVTQFRNLVHLAFAPDGRTLAASWSSDVGVWEVATGRERLRVARPFASAARIAFSPDGRLAAVGTVGGAVQILDAADGWELAELAGCAGGVTCLAFAPDGKTLATGGADGAVLIWEGKDWARKERPGAEIPADKVAARWDELRDADAVRAYRAVQALARSPKAAAPYLKEKLLAVEAVDAKRVAGLIEKLNDDQLKVRDEAENELANLGSQAVPFLREALNGSPPAETRRRLQGLLEPRKDSSTATEEVRNLRAVEALERAGAPEAVEALRALAKDAPNADVMQEAAAALGRLPAGAR